jgi:predicted GNAT family acetyltransferase
MKSCGLRQAARVHRSRQKLMGPDMAAVRDNKALNRFEMDVEDAMAFANYRLTPDAVIITHTETPRALRGRGIASELVKGALELIRADGRKVIAGCGFVVDYLDKHPEYADLAA